MAMWQCIHPVMYGGKCNVPLHPQLGKKPDGGSILSEISDLLTEQFSFNFR